MKALPRKAIILSLQIIIWSSVNQLFAQTDSMKISYGQERADSSDYNYHRKYQYLDINLKDETKMFKIAIPTFSLAHNNDPIATTPSSEDFSFYFEYERKINQAWSVIVSNSNSLGVSATTSITTDLNWGVRYYINMAEQIKHGTRGNNCNGIYVGFFLLDLNQFQYTQNYVVVNPTKYNYYHLSNFSALIQAPTFDLDLGLQKRLNNFSFINTKIYLEFTPDRNQIDQKPVVNNLNVVTSYSNINSTALSHFNFGLSFSIGLGWGWK